MLIAAVEYETAFFDVVEVAQVLRADLGHGIFEQVESAGGRGVGCAQSSAVELEAGTVAGEVERESQ